MLEGEKVIYEINKRIDRYIRDSDDLYYPKKVYLNYPVLYSSNEIGVFTELDVNSIKRNGRGELVDTYGMTFSEMKKFQLHQPVTYFWDWYCFDIFNTFEDFWV